jgi:hypothetical protein
MDSPKFTRAQCFYVVPQNVSFRKKWNSGRRFDKSSDSVSLVPRRFGAADRSERSVKRGQIFWRDLASEILPPLQAPSRSRPDTSGYEMASKTRWRRAALCLVNGHVEHQNCGRRSNQSQNHLQIWSQD